jgi:hypothetical protein
MRHMILICVSVVGIISIAHAQKAPASFGVLTCTFIKPGQDAAHKMSCGFKPAGTGAEEKYSGTIRESSKELPSGKIVLIWTVLAPAEEKMRAGILAQRYVKATRVSGESPMLVGETNPAIALQFETNDGAAPYETITQMELQLTGTSASAILPRPDRHISETRVRIADQRNRIARQMIAGHATAISRELLSRMEEALRLTIAHRALIIQEI